MHQYYLNAIKSFEGFTQQAKWDYAQHTNGFGTKALFPGEQIDRAEAHRRFTAEIEKAREFVEKHARNWDEGTKAALTSLTFNAGTKWASSGLGEAVRNNDVDGVREKFLAYTKAGGEDLPGLVRRRLAEVTWIAGPTGAVSSGVESPAASSPSQQPRDTNADGNFASAPELTERATPAAAPGDRPPPTPPLRPSMSAPSVIVAGSPLASSSALYLLTLDLQLLRQDELQAGESEGLEPRTRAV
ncbi:MAG: lysozyme [Hyphomicrobiaceae bacterium]